MKVSVKSPARKFKIRDELSKRIYNSKSETSSGFLISSLSPDG